MSIMKVFFTVVTTAAASYAAYKLFIEKQEKEAIVRSKEVKTEARIERYEETEGSGWTVPDGAYDVHSKQEIKKYNYVNGYQMPVYEVKYTYKVKKWVYNRSVSDATEGLDTAKAALKAPTGEELSIGDERMLEPVVSYTVLAADAETGEFLRIPVGKEIYDAVNADDILTYKVRRCAPKTYTNLGIGVKGYPGIKKEDSDDTFVTEDAKTPDGDNGSDTDE